MEDDIILKLQAVVDECDAAFRKIESLKQQVRVSLGLHHTTFSVLNFFFLILISKFDKLCRMGEDCHCMQMGNF